MTYYMLCCARLLCHVPLFATPWTVAPQAPLSMGFSRQGYCSGLSCPPPGDLPDPGIKPRSPALQAYSLLSEPLGKAQLFQHQLLKQKQSQQSYLLNTVLKLSIHCYQ